MAVINLASFVSSVPIATRAMTAALIGLSTLMLLLRLTLTDKSLHLISFSADDSAIAFPWLVIVPGSSFWYPWTLLTSAFCETGFFEFLISLVTLPLAGRYLERIWGPVELLRFSVIVIVVSNVVTWFIAIVMYVVLGSELVMYGTQFHGLEALQTGFLVALAQLIPEHQVQFKFGLKVRVRDLPMAYVTFSNVVCIFGYLSPFILIQFGWLSSWAYLRFFKMNENGVRGDRSETFSLVQWFPPFLHKPVTIISNFLYGIFLRLGVVQPWQYSAMGDVELGVGSGLPSMSVGIGSQGSAGGGGGTRAEAERRRAMALKALDQRVKAGAAVGSGAAASSPTGSGGAGSSAGFATANGDPAAPNATQAGAAISKPTAARTADGYHVNGKPSGVPRVVVQEASDEGGNSPADEGRGAPNGTR